LFRGGLFALWYARHGR